MTQALTRITKPEIMTAIEEKNLFKVFQTMDLFRLPSGKPDYHALFTIPHEQRINDLSKRDKHGTLACIAAGIRLNLEMVNIARPINDTQIMYVAMALVKRSETLQLAIEDVMLFMENVISGKYGALYESLDASKLLYFFEEKYVGDRCEVNYRMEEERAAQHKAMGDNRTTRDMERERLRERRNSYEKSVNENREATLKDNMEKFTKFFQLYPEPSLVKETENKSVL